jgi:hypothetical protein
MKTMTPFRVLQVSIVVVLLFGSTWVVRALGMAAEPAGSSRTWHASQLALAGPLQQGDNGDNDDGDNDDGGDNNGGGDNTFGDNDEDNDDGDNDDSGNDNGYDDNENFDDFDLPPYNPAPARPPQPVCAEPGQETVFTSYDEKVAVRVFPSTPQPVRVEILQVIDFLSAPLPPGNLVGLLAYEIRASRCDSSPLAQFPAEVNLGIRYSEIEATGLDESRFVIGRLDLTTGVWSPIEKRANDPSSNYVSATIIDTGFYMVWEQR